MTFGVKIAQSLEEIYYIRFQYFRRKPLQVESLPIGIQCFSHRKIDPTGMTSLPRINPKMTDCSPNELSFWMQGVGRDNMLRESESTVVADETTFHTGFR
jgi:hypothetical protein